MAFKATDYLITPRDIILFLRGLFRLSWRQLLQLFGLIVVFFLARHFGAGFVDASFLTYLVGVFVYNIDARISISCALFLLVLIVVIMIAGPHTEFINETTWPEPIAVWVYYFLAIGVLKQIKDMYSDKHGEIAEGTDDDLYPNSQVGEFPPLQHESPQPLSVAPASPSRTQRAGVVELSDYGTVFHSKYVVTKKGTRISVTLREPIKKSRKQKSIL